MPTLTKEALNRGKRAWLLTQARLIEALNQHVRPTRSAKIKLPIKLDSEVSVVASQQAFRDFLRDLRKSTADFGSSLEYPMFIGHRDCFVKKGDSVEREIREATVDKCYGDVDATRWIREFRRPIETHVASARKWFNRLAGVGRPTEHSPYKWCEAWKAKTGNTDEVAVKAFNRAHSKRKRPYSVNALLSARKRQKQQS